MLVKPGLVEPLAADRADHPVHHAGRGDDVGAGPGVADGWRARSGSVASLSTSIRPSGPADQGAAVAVVGVLAEADVGDDQEIRAPDA